MPGGEQGSPGNETGIRLMQNIFCSIEIPKLEEKTALHQSSVINKNME
jgi:hypothetical protein